MSDLSPRDLAEAQVIFERSPVEAAIDAHRALSVITDLWNAGPAGRRIALSMADDDLRQFQRQHRAGEQEKSR